MGYELNYGQNKDVDRCYVGDKRAFSYFDEKCVNLCDFARQHAEMNGAIRRLSRFRAYT